MIATRYQETVYQPRWVIVMLALIAIAEVVGAAAFAWRGEPVPAIALGLGALLVTWIGRALRYFFVEIDEAGLRYGWAGTPAGRIARADIASAEKVPYPWIYGWGWRIAGRTVCYSIPFERRALAVTRRSGFFRRYLFTLKGVDEAAAALKEVVLRHEVR